MIERALHSEAWVSLAPLVQDKEEGINQQDHACQHIGNHVTHKGLSFASHDPEQHHQCEECRQDVERQEGHRSPFARPEMVTAMLRNNIVMAMPMANVSQGIDPAAPGTKTPTTSEAKMIFAPSRKKSTTTPNSSRAAIVGHSTFQEKIVKGQEGTS